MISLFFPFVSFPDLDKNQVCMISGVDWTFPKFEFRMEFIWGGCVCFESGMRRIVTLKFTHAGRQLIHR